MRCPKCHYLSFDPEPRCRNCGYGLSLDEADLLIRDEDTQTSPFADLAIQGSDASAPPTTPAASTSRSAAPAAAPVPRPRSPFAGIGGLPPAADTPGTPPPVFPPPAPRPRPAPTTELPLFVRGASNADLARVDDPLVRLPAETRPPLSVRRNVADPPAPRPRPANPASARTAGPLDRDLLADLERLEEHNRRAAARAPEVLDEEAGCRAGAGHRLFAAAIDGALLGALSATVMWITLRWCELPLDRALMLSVLLPTSAFLFLVGIGYLVLFTAAGGQTLGKMAAGIRVIADAPEPADRGPLGLGQAVLRAVVALPSVLAAGLGLLPALVGDQRAVHDRLARTRVVRA